jgi:hypothetical protein
MLPLLIRHFLFALLLQLHHRSEAAHWSRRIPHLE